MSKQVELYSWKLAGHHSHNLVHFLATNVDRGGMPSAEHSYIHHPKMDLLPKREGSLFHDTRIIHTHRTGSPGTGDGLRVQAGQGEREAE
eukprot:354840-Pelagomonas_calceolata.AAC.2